MRLQTDHQNALLAISRTRNIIRPLFELEGLLGRDAFCAAQRRAA